MDFHTLSESQITVVDFSNPEMKPGTDTWVSGCEVVRRALEDHGAFLALFDKVDDSIFTACQHLFDLPTHTKMQPTSDKPHHGYFGQLSSSPLFESLAVDNPLSIQDCHNFTHIMWPAGNDPFCKTTNACAKVLVELDRTVKRMVFESYGVESEKCESFLESNNYVMRYFKYRPAEVDENEMGVETHEDSTLLTILHQHINGLELQSKHGHWVGVDSSPNLFCVLAGEAFMVWSNDRIRANSHRVIMKSKVARYSVGLLSYAANTLQPAEELVDDQHPTRYKPFNHYDYLSFRQSEEVIRSECRIKLFCGI